MVAVTMEQAARCHQPFEQGKPGINPPAL